MEEDICNWIPEQISIVNVNGIEIPVDEVEVLNIEDSGSPFLDTPILDHLSNENNYFLNEDRRKCNKKTFNNLLTYTYLNIIYVLIVNFLIKKLVDLNYQMLELK